MTFHFPRSSIRGLPANAADALERSCETRPPDRSTGTAAAAVTPMIKRRGQSRYAAGIAERLLGQLSDGRSLCAACRDQGMPPSTVLQWVADDRDGFAARYRRARQIGKASTGQRPFYTAEIAQRILDELCNGRPLMQICRAPGMPSRSLVQLWAAQDRDGFAARYRRAKAIGGAGPGPRSIYTADIANRIVNQLLEGRTLADVCRSPGMPGHATVRQWVTDNREGFAARYRLARQLGSEAIEEQILEIADDSRGDWKLRRRKDGTTAWVVDHENITRARLQINALNRQLSNARPRKGGSWRWT